MNNAFRALLSLSVLSCTLAVTAQTPAAPAAGAAPAAAQAAPALTADEVVAHYVAAIGGKDTLAKIKSISMETSVQVMGNEVPNMVTIADGVGYKSETEFNGAKIIQCYSDKSGWNVNPMTGSADPAPMSEDEYKAGKDQIFVGGGLVDYAGRGGKAELLSKDASTYKVKLTSKENVESTYVIDGSTWLVKTATRKGSMQGQEVDVTTTFSDYRKTDQGYTIPYVMDVDLGGQFSLNITVKKVEFNKTIDPAIFAMPKAG